MATERLNDITGEIVDSCIKIHPIHESQILTYMRLSNVKTGLLINFNVPLMKDGIKRYKL